MKRRNVVACAISFAAVSPLAAPLLVVALLGSSFDAAFAQEDKKTDEDKPADPDTGESTVEETTLGLLPNPFQKYGIKFAATYIGETLGNVSGGLKQGAIYEGDQQVFPPKEPEPSATLKPLASAARHK